LKDLLKNSWTFLFALALLVVSLAAFMQILFYARDESSYDRFHAQHKDIYRVEGELVLENGESYQQATTPMPLGAVLVEEFSEITHAVRFTRPYPKTILSSGNDLKFSERGGIWADTSFFEIFSFPFISGTAETALSQPDSIVLTRSLAEKYFPDSNLLGQTLRINNRFDYEVTGVVENVPRRSHFRFDFVVSSDFSGRFVSSWQSSTVFTYILLPDPVKKKLMERLRRVLADHGAGANKFLYLKPLTQIHLGSDVRFEFEHNQEKGTITLYLSLASLLLLLAGMNLTNHFLIPVPDLSRKAQLSRTGLLALLSGLLAPLLAIFFLPGFGRLVQREWEIGLSRSLTMVITSLLLALALCFGATFLADLLRKVSADSSPSDKSDQKRGETLWYKRMTVVFGFFVVSVLFLAAVLIFRQYQHLQKQGWGMPNGQVIIMDLSSVSTERENRTALFRNELLKNPNILSVTNALSLPFTLHGTSTVSMNAVAPNFEVLVNVNFVDEGFVDTFGLEYLEGGRSIAVPEGVQICILNESAARVFLPDQEIPDYSDLVGKQVRFSANTFLTVIGVVKDFPVSFKKDRIEPLILVFLQGRFSVHPHLALRLYSGGIQTTLEFIQHRFEAIFPEDVFEVRSFSESSSGFFQAEQIHARILFYIFLAALCLALLGLGSMELFGPHWQRENKIRLILAGNLIAWPLVYLAVQAWLGRFALKAEIPLWLFLASGLILFILALLIVNVRTIPYWLRGIKWVIFYLCTWLVIEPRFIYSSFGIMRKMPAIRPENSLLQAVMERPGGMIETLSGFLSQFYYIPWVGAVIITVAAWALSWCLGQLLLLATDDRSRFLRYLPALFLFMLYNQYEHVLGMALALLAALLSALGFEKLNLPRGIAKSGLFVLFFAGLYLLTGGVCLIFAAVAALFAVFQHRDYVLAGGISFLSVVLSFFLHGLLFDSGALPFFGDLPVMLLGQTSSWVSLLRHCLFLSVPVILAAWFLGKPLRLHKFSLPRARLWSTAGLILLFILGIRISSNPEQKLLHKMIHFARHEKWSQILQQAREMPRDLYNMYINYQINRALYHTGRLGDEMFAYVQNMAAQAIIALEDERYAMRDIAISDITLDMGALNISEHLAHELIEISGTSPFLVERLFWINFGKKQYENGRIFLNAFSKDLVHGKRGRDVQRRLKVDPQLTGSGKVRYLNAVVLEKDYANIDVETLLTVLLEKNRYNRMAFEYLMGYYLMTRQVDKVVENLGRLDDFGYTEIPVHYEEAIYLYALNTGEDVKLGWRSVRPDISERFGAFARIMADIDQPRQQEALLKFAQEHPGSYFIYYSFDRSGMIE